MALEGTQPTSTQVPPTVFASQRATEAPRSRARIAAANAALPEPTIIRSYVSGLSPKLVTVRAIVDAPFRSSRPIRADPGAARQMLLVPDDERPRDTDELAHEGIREPVHDVTAPAFGQHEPTPLEARQVVRDAALRSADDRDELSDRSLTLEQGFDDAEPCRVPEHAEEARRGFRARVGSLRRAATGAWHGHAYNRKS